MWFQRPIQGTIQTHNETWRRTQSHILSCIASQAFACKIGPIKIPSFYWKILQTRCKWPCPMFKHHNQAMSGMCNSCLLAVVLNLQLYLYSCYILGIYRCVSIILHLYIIWNNNCISSLYNANMWILHNVMNKALPQAIAVVDKCINL